MNTVHRGSRAALLVAACSAGLAGAQALPGRPAQGGVLLNPASRLCADVDPGSARNGAPVQLGDCRGLGSAWNVFEVGRGEYAIVNRASGLALEVRGGSRTEGTVIQQYEWNATPAQRWRLEGQGTTRFVNAGSGLCLDVAAASREAGSTLVQGRCHGGENQLWRLGAVAAAQPMPKPRGEPLPEGRLPGRILYSGMLHSRATGKCVDVAGGETGEGVDIRQWSCNGTPAQLFDVVDVGRGEVAFVARNSGKVMDVTGESRRSGADVVQRSWQGGDNQRWRMEATERGYSRIVSVGSGKCLDLEGGRAEDGTNILQFDCHTGPNQQWRVEIRGAGADWTGYRPGSDNWRQPDSAQYDEPPAFLVGDFRATNGYYGSRVDLSVHSDGVVIARVEGNQRIFGYYRDGNLFLGNLRYEVTQERTGFRVTPAGQRDGGVSYRRAPYESPRTGR